MQAPNLEMSVLGLSQLTINSLRRPYLESHTWTAHVPTTAASESQETFLQKKDDHNLEAAEGGHDMDLCIGKENLRYNISHTLKAFVDQTFTDYR